MTRRPTSVSISHRTAALVAILLLLAGCGTHPSTPTRSAGPVASTGGAGPPAPGTPTGRRWVGIGDRVVAVPRGWETVAGTACTSARARQVAVRTGDAAALRCVRERSGSPAVTLSPPGSPGWSEGPGVRCGASTSGPCSALVGNRADGFRVTYRGPHAQRELEALHASATTVPDGWVAVPPISYGASDEDGVRLLEAAGLVGVRPEVDWPHYVVGTEPAAGSVVAEGSEVALVPGDG